MRDRKDISQPENRQMLEILKIIRLDLDRTYKLMKGGRLIKIINCIRSPGVQVMIILRFGQWSMLQPKLVRLFTDPVYFLLNGILKIMWGIEIARVTQIGAGFYIGHFGGITISPQAVIGNNCSISQGVTIGVSGQGDKSGAPTIGDNVYIAPGAKVFGKITIGSNVKIGANAVIYQDLPDNVIAVLSPGFQIIGEVQKS
jgi:serine O-acetyltransferase